MNTEEDEFRRIEAEAKRRAAQDEDDDTQSYTSEMLLAEAYRCGYEPTCPECKAKVLFECVACSSNNYPTQQQAEPVAFYDFNKGFYWAKPTKIVAPTVVDVPPIPLYTTAAKREWVGLTPEEILNMFDVNNVYGSKWIEFARTVESALRSKNT
jgi:hypothetical protein